MSSNALQSVTRLRSVVGFAPANADPTGVADSTAAFNAATAALRASLVDTPDYDYGGVVLTIPPGIYSISSWDLTDLLMHNVHVVAPGVVLVARTAGKHVIDCLGSRYIKFHGLMVYSASTVLAKSGVQLGPKGVETCGNMAFNDVTIAGHFASAPLMNLGAETTNSHNLRLIQRHVAAGAFALIADGLSTYLPTSDYVAITRTPGQALSFTTNSFFGCQIRNEGGGSAAYLAKTQGWSFDMGTYWLSFNDSAVIVHGTTVYRSDKLVLRGSFESSNPDSPTPGNTGLKYGVTFSNDGTGTAINGFTFESSNMHATVAVFRSIGGSTMRLSDADLRVHSIDQAGAVLFGAGTLSVDGVLVTQQSSRTNLAALTAFNGVIHCDSYAALASLPVAGAYVIFARTEAQTYYGGKHAFTGVVATVFTPTVTFATPGDLAVSYAVQVASYSEVGNQIYFTITLTFTPTFTTASGILRIGGLPKLARNLTNENHAIGVSYINSAFAWPASATQVIGRILSNTSYIELLGLGNGIAGTVFTTANVASGSAKTVSLSGVYQTA